MRRIVVVGATGSGKTTLAATLAEHLHLPHTELDALHWQANWQPAPRDEMVQNVQALVQKEAWITDGNYSRVQPLILARADTLIWLDYPLGVNFWRLLQRTTRRVVTQQELWDGCRETWQGVFSRESIFWWLWKSHKKLRRNYTELTRSPEAAHLCIVRLQSPRNAAAWLHKVAL